MAFILILDWGVEGEAKVAFILFFLKKLGSRVSARLWRGYVPKKKIKKKKKNVAKKEPWRDDSVVCYFNFTRGVNSVLF